MYGIIFNLHSNLSSENRIKFFKEADKVFYANGFYNKFGLYVTREEPLAALVGIKSKLQTDAPNFCHNIIDIHVFKMEDFSNITDVIKL